MSTVALQGTHALLSSGVPYSRTGALILRLDTISVANISTNLYGTSAAHRYIRHVPYQGTLQQESSPKFSYQTHVTDISIGRTRTNNAQPTVCSLDPHQEQQMPQLFKSYESDAAPVHKPKLEVRVLSLGSRARGNA